jgi:hydroxyethylthiazole kinase-like uncharacterized protein yjeF
MTANVLLTVEEMYRAEKLAVASGVPSIDLMEAAGSGIARIIAARFSPRRTLILCGPGNNGGDGFVVARLLKEAGWPVTVAVLSDPAKLAGDAAINWQRWGRDFNELTPKIFDEPVALVVDALFGAGLQRPLDGIARKVIEIINARTLPCIAVDVPSGVDGATGKILGTAPNSALTITFFRRKPGHLLFPGRACCGDVQVIDIGIPNSVLTGIKPQNFANSTELWLRVFPWPRYDTNKFNRGHLIVAGSDAMTGAARLAAHGARRVGCGLVTIAAPPAAVPIYAADMPGTLVQPLMGKDAFAKILSDTRKNAVLIGPGAGINAETRIKTLAALAAKKRCVLDADTFTVFKDSPDDLFGAIRAPTILTPHEGEFRRMFGGDGTGNKLSRVRVAAAQSGAVILLKGADTVIAAPDGRATINSNAPPDLATAGSGDVLAGFIAGLLAQGMAAFEAAAAGAWLHGAAGMALGTGLIAEDLPEAVRAILQHLNSGTKNEAQPPNIDN